MIMRSDAIVGDYPNTYTYTKGLCERLMQRRKKDLPVCIVRPAIINTSYREPFPGWLDSIAAAAAFYLFVGLGIIKVIDGDSSKIGDTVPVDVVVANIIAATAYNFKNSKLSIYHVGTSDRNPITWGECRDTVTTFWNSNVSQSRVSRSQLLFT